MEHNRQLVQWSPCFLVELFSAISVVLKSGKARPMTFDFFVEALLGLTSNQLGYVPDEMLM